MEGLNRNKIGKLLTEGKYDPIVNKDNRFKDEFIEIVKKMLSPNPKNRPDLTTILNSPSYNPEVC